jgi:hypothetical protein
MAHIFYWYCKLHAAPTYSYSILKTWCSLHVPSICIPKIRFLMLSDKCTTTWRDFQISFHIPQFQSPISQHAENYQLPDLLGIQSLIVCHLLILILPSSWQSCVNLVWAICHFSAVALKTYIVLNVPVNIHWLCISKCLPQCKSNDTCTYTKFKLEHHHYTWGCSVKFLITSSCVEVVVIHSCSNCSCSCSCNCIFRMCRSTCMCVDSSLTVLVVM